MRIRSFFVVATIAFLTVTSVWAWTAPVSVPPTGNTPKPINVSSETQMKAGNFIAPIFATYGQMQSNRYCDLLGNNCTNTLTATGTRITALTGGLGIVLNPTTITSTGTISANLGVLQARMTTSCPVGQLIRSVNSDGTVVCQPVPTNVPCIHKSQSFSSGYSCRTGSESCPVAGGGGTTNFYIVCQADGTWSSYSTSCSTPINRTNCP